MLDLGAFFEIAQAPAHPGLIQALVEGWVAENDRVEPFSCTDVRTGLATLAHLERLLYDVSLGSDENRNSWTMATLSVLRRDQSLAHEWTLLAEIGEAFRIEFDRMDAAAAVDRTAIHLLINRSPACFSSLGRFQRRVDTIESMGLCSTSIEFRAMPQTREEYVTMISDLRRCHAI
ncbi:hypothetical protein QEH68_21835 (plasmid) [Paenarthrobacter sp. OM7]|uniref:hypothetical protein n=1 Tax=Paenarthrobacter sp. OM7 TaxID=3041264 RepID=UPI002469A8A1|nr:hypothetical protein [Paenarthrobacter sp. OM7]WGM22907.1 hypothetical protein QEH68_21835 [Paenarthrobacter sp. OM7]